MDVKNHSETYRKTFPVIQHVGHTWGKQTDWVKVTTQWQQTLSIMISKEGDTTGASEVEASCCSSSYKLPPEGAISNSFGFDVFAIKPPASYNPDRHSQDHHVTLLHSACSIWSSTFCL